MKSPNRILCHGVTGSGKSTLAAEIAARTGLPLILVDELTWRPGWVEVPEADQRALFAEIAARERWVMDSSYGKWRDQVQSRAELIVALDYPRWLSFSRLARRTLRRLVTGERVCNGNVETPDKTFSRDSILLWHFRSFRRKRAVIRAWEADPERRILVFRHPRETARWLASLEPVELEHPSEF